MEQGHAALRLINSRESSIGSTITRHYLPETEELAIYTDKPLGKLAGKELATRVAVAFPEMTPAKAMLLIEMMIDEGFSEQRSMDAVKHVIKQHVAWGKEPPIGAFIQFDRRVKLLSYRELNTRHDKGEIAWSDYEPIDVGLEKPRWAKREDVLRYNLTKWMVKQQQQGGRL